MTFQIRYFCTETSAVFIKRLRIRLVSKHRETLVFLEMKLEEEIRFLCQGSCSSEGAIIIVAVFFVVLIFVFVSTSLLSSSSRL